MMKKAFSVLLAACLLVLCAIPAVAEDASDPTDLGVISLKLNSDVGGFTDSDFDKLIEINSGSVVCSNIWFYDYAGTTILDDKIVAGRSYTADYLLSAAPGFEMPESIDDLDVRIECGEGVKVINVSVTYSKIRNEDGEFEIHHNLKVFAKVLVDGSAFQRIIGRIVDIFLKIRAWSLY